MSFKFRSAAFLTVAPVFALSLSAAAQTSRGILSGTAHDATGAVVPGAAITATNIDTKESRKTTSLANGSYRLDALQPGRYRVEATSAGFSKSQIDDLTVSPSVVTSYDISFAIGGGTETVTVEANNTGVNTENGQLAGVIGGQQLQNLPIFTLNPVELALTVLASSSSARTATSPTV